jgi:hypothetical protein
VTYTNTSAAPNTGNRTINYVVNDGTVNSNTAAKTVSVTAVNDAPVNSVPGTQSTYTSTAEVFSVGNSSLISISDVDAASASVQVQLVSTNGATTLSGVTGLTFTVGDGTADATMTFTGTIANINTALAGLSFNPTAAFNGTATLQIVTNDQGNTGTGGALSDTDSVSITVAPNLGIFTNTFNVGAGAGGPTSSSYSSGTGVYTEVGNGADIANATTDEFHYLYKSITGDSTIIARVTALGTAQQYAKAAVMFRETTNDDSKYVRIDIHPTGSNGTEWGVRATTTGTTTSQNYTGPAPVWWVKSVRIGNTFSQWSAPDSSGAPGTWTQRGATQTVSMPSTILVGLATCAHSATTVTATYDHVTVS